MYFNLISLRNTSVGLHIRSGGELKRTKENIQVNSFYNQLL